MKRWVLERWHRFTLGRTARPISYKVNGHAGSVAHVAYRIDLALIDALPLNVCHEVLKRAAYDLPMGSVRVVIEVGER
jgi:hypothetical protein